MHSKRTKQSTYGNKWLSSPHRESQHMSYCLDTQGLYTKGLLNKFVRWHEHDLNQRIKKTTRTFAGNPVVQKQFVAFTITVSIFCDAIRVKTALRRVLAFVCGCVQENGGQIRLSSRSKAWLLTITANQGVSVAPEVANASSRGRIRGKVCLTKSIRAAREINAWRKRCRIQGVWMKKKKR
jgi:hypothetical protein